MVLQNLVFNRMGNSFSALLLYKDQSIQLWDDVKTQQFEIKHVCTSEDKPFSVIVEIKGKNFSVEFNDKGFVLKEFFFLVSSESFFISFSDPEYIFKLSMTQTSFINIKNNQNSIDVFIPQQNFFKGLTEFLHLMNFL